MTENKVGITIVFDAKTGKARIAIRDVDKLHKAVDKAGNEMKEAGRKAGGFFRHFRQAHG